MEGNKEWYVVSTVSGYEYKVKEKLDMRIDSMNLQDNIFRVIIPEQKEVEVKEGKQKEKIKKMFPGYVLVEMIMSDETWYIIRNTQGVTGFLGSSGKGAKPVPLLPSEVDKILGSMGMSRLDLGNDVSEGDKLRVTDGPFKGMFGKAKDIDLENGKLNIVLDLFGQETLVEVELHQIEKY